MSEKKVFVAGHQGMVGKAITQCLECRGYTSIITADRSQVDLTRQNQVEEFMRDNHVDQIYIAAAKVGGILANNTYPADFLYDNLMIAANVISAAHRSDISRLLFLGSSCIYPKIAEQPMTEETLLTGPLEPTNEPYAIAKIAGIKLCESYNRQYGRDYRSVMPTNLYGPNDNFHPENSHVIPALLRRFHEAKQRNDRDVIIWGSGNQRREFIYVEDMAAACVHVMELEQSIYKAHTSSLMSHVNVGSGVDCSIRELAYTVARVVGFEGELIFDVDKPDGAPRKLLDVSRLQSMGWRADVTLEDGLYMTYRWFVENQGNYRT